MTKFIILEEAQVLMRIAIFGTGGVGGYFGGRLAQAGEEVVFIARGEQLQALCDQGLRVDSIKGDFVIHPLQATDDPAQVGTVDVVIVGVKAWQVTEAARVMRPLIGSETFIVPLQNGVDAPAQLAAVVGAGHVLGGLCKIVSFVVEPGHIRHAGLEPYVAFGELHNHLSERVERLHEAFARAGVTAEIPSNIQAALWDKFLFIASFSGVGAVTRAPAGVLRSLPETRQMLEQAMQEVLAVARAHGIPLPEEATDRAMALVDGLPPDGTASMQRDVMEGRPSELESQNGAVVRLGQEVGVATPLHAFIYHSLLPLELRARGQMQNIKQV
ncbi:MAG: 2-dehydropantoate 2-reductase [Chloroflexota bacterium]|nr:2-dehydropantoate 2-reductase [Chloroflexota bacterium]